MKRIIFPLIIGLLLVGQTQQGWAQSKSFDISDITAIEINIACQLVIVQGQTPNIEIVGDKRALASLETNVRNGKFTITSDRRNQQKEDVVVKIEVQNLEHLAIGGVVDMKSARELKFPNFKLSVSGVASGDLEITAKTLRLSCSGVCNLDIKGKTDEPKMNVSGVGNIDAVKLKARVADVQNSGVGRIVVMATETLDASVSGVGSISYAGEPQVRANVSGLGRVKRY
ncbi:MAG: head GIN domain-containing protein [Tenuifilaceae bacterium]|jgi:hypothetical protein|nr:head GIN domain-containing protein [Tenuifilaceae bacterium]